MVPSALEALFYPDTKYGLCTLEAHSVQFFPLSRLPAGPDAFVGIIESLLRPKGRNYCRMADTTSPSVKRNEFPPGCSRVGKDGPTEGEKLRGTKQSRAGPVYA